MINEKFDSYGYKEAEAFVTVSEQKGLKYAYVKDVQLPITEEPNFYNEKGQTLTDLVTVEL